MPPDSRLTTPGGHPARERVHIGQPARSPASPPVLQERYTLSRAAWDLSLAPADRLSLSAAIGRSIDRRQLPDPRSPKGGRRAASASAACPSRPDLSAHNIGTAMPFLRARSGKIA